MTRDNKMKEEENNLAPRVNSAIAIAGLRREEEGLSENLIEAMTLLYLPHFTATRRRTRIYHHLFHYSSDILPITTHRFARACCVAFLVLPIILTLDARAAVFPAPIRSQPAPLQ